MYQNINGVKFREYPETLEKPLLEKRFDILYIDDTYYQNFFSIQAVPSLKKYSTVSMFFFT